VYFTTDVFRGDLEMSKISYDNQGDILEIKFSDVPVKDSEYVEESGIVMDYDENSKLVGLEITSFSKRVNKLQDIAAIAM